MTVFNSSAIVVVYNEMKHLEDCLKSCSNSQEILVYDMGSVDGSINLAEKYATEVRHISQVEIVEKIWAKIIDEASNDWIILLDPDEIFPTTIFSELEKVILEDSNIALFSIPWKYYFLGNPLQSTSWGRDHFKARVFNRNHVDISGVLFDGIKLKPGFTKYTFPYEAGFIIQHYWVDSIPQLYSKHWRYIKNDGEARYKKGERFSIRMQLKDSISSLCKNLIDYQGIKDGWRGIFLSLFHSWFIFMCHASLCRYQFFYKQIKNNDISV